MAISKLELLEKRIESLEKEIKEVRQQFGNSPSSALPWWEQRWGTFDNDPDYEKAMELGRKYRESLRPKASKSAMPKRAIRKAVKAGKR